MCQPKSKGGKRCLAHAAASKFVVRTTIAATKADANTVNKVMSQLNKEGKLLPAPAPAEVSKWIDTQKFVAQYDPDLDEHDRKIGLSQLARAEEEVKAGVTGGQFHAWKNLKEVVRGKIGRRVAALALTPLIAFGAVGCATGDNPLDGVGNLGNGTSQEVVLEGYSLTESGDLVKDELGSYAQTPRFSSDQSEDSADTINIQSQAEEFYNANPDLAANGFTKEDVAEGLSTSYNFLFDTVYDTSIMDRPVTNAEYGEWMNEISSTYNLSSEMNEGLSDPSTPVTSRAFDSESPGMFVPLVRDGNKRYLTDSASGQPALINNVRPDSVEVTEYNGQPHMVIAFTTKMPYRLSDSNAISLMSKHLGMTKDEVIAASVTDLTDNKGDNILVLEGSANVITFKTDQGLQIAGSQNHYTLSTELFAAEPDNG